MSRIFLALMGLLLMSGIQAQNTYNIIPQPKQLVAMPGVFTLKRNNAVTVGNEMFQPVADLLASQLNRASGFALTVKKGTSGSGIVFTENPKLKPEGYRLNVTAKKVEIQASTGQGAFYGLQTLLQLMPPQISGADVVATAISIPNCVVDDEPRFGYRGMMLDAGRYFFPVEDVKRFIDLMAVYKLNTFHWHLTEDQGWRIEIKKYPLLTQISSVRKETMLGHYRDKKFDGKPYGGFYTQDQVKEIVAYAAQKYVTILSLIHI